MRQVLFTLLILLAVPDPSTGAELLTAEEQDFETDPSPGRWVPFVWGQTDFAGEQPGILDAANEYVSGRPITVASATGAPEGWGERSLHFFYDDPIADRLHPHVGGIRIRVPVMPGEPYTISGNLLFEANWGNWQYGAGMSVDTHGGTDARDVTHGHLSSHAILAPDLGQLEGDCAWSQDPDYNNEKRWFTPDEFKMTVTAESNSLTVYLWALARYAERASVQMDGISIQGPPYTGPPLTPTPTPNPNVLPVTSIIQSARTVGLYEPMTVEFDLGRNYSNPFDPRIVDVNFEFTGPSGKTRTIPAFWTSGSPEWQARIAPLEIGHHECRIVARDNEDRTGATTLDFEAVPSGCPGFIRRDSRNPYYLRFDNGDPYFPIGYNMCWNHDDFRYSRWMELGAENGINWSRIWVVPFVKMGIEWGLDLEPEFRGLGTYSPVESSRYDTTLDRARSLNIYYQFCMDSYNSWNKNVWENWFSSPYYSGNGGFMDFPIEFLTDPEARRLAKQRFRYIVSRWGYQTSVLCWEFFNEVDIMGTGDDPSRTYRENRDLGAAWHQEMAQYIQSIDPFGHLLSTSFAEDSEAWPEIWDLPEIGIVNLHRYASDIPVSHYEKVVYSRRYNKPIIYGEANADGGGMGKPLAVPANKFGTTLSKTSGPHEASIDDPNGLTLHRQIWAMAVAESGAMSWWWDTWIHPRDLYHHFKPLATFLEGEDWAIYHMAPIDPVIVSTHSPRAIHIFGSASRRGGMIYVYFVSPNSTVTGLSIRIPGIAASNLKVEFWDTGTGVAVSSSTVSSGSDGLVLDFPPFTGDMAVKMKSDTESPSWAVR